MSAGNSSLLATSCLYFGTFNPIHTGHLMIAQAALYGFSDTLGIESITFIPAGNPPHRHQESDLLESRHRFKMVQLATASNPAFHVSDIELQRPEKSYTVETLRLLMSQGQIKTPVPMIIGSDALAGLANWHEPETLMDMVCFMQAPRPDYPWITAIELQGRTRNLNTRPLEMPLLSLSSTWIRQMLRQAAHPEHLLRYYLPEPVRQYIFANQLYRT